MRTLLSLCKVCSLVVFALCEVVREGKEGRWEKRRSRREEEKRKEGEERRGNNKKGRKGEIGEWQYNVCCLLISEGTYITFVQFRCQHQL